MQEHSLKEPHMKEIRGNVSAVNMAHEGGGQFVLCWCPVTVEIFRCFCPKKMAELKEQCLMVLFDIMDIT